MSPCENASAKLSPIGYSTFSLENLIRKGYPRFFTENEYIDRFEVSEDGKWLKIHLKITRPYKPGEYLK